MSDSPELQDPAPLRDQIQEKIDQLFDMNQRVVRVLKAQASDFELIGTYFVTMGQKAYDIAADIAGLSFVASQNTSNIIIAQFGHDDDTTLIDLSGGEDIDDDDESDE